MILELVTKECKWQSALRVACVACFCMHSFISFEIIFFRYVITKVYLSKDYREMFWEERDGKLNGAGGSGEVEGLTRVLTRY